jgi:VacB/RNase II family 3'-5' exoribonuclease
MRTIFDLADIARVYRSRPVYLTITRVKPVISSDDVSDVLALTRISDAQMREFGMRAELSRPAQRELDAITRPATDAFTRDLTALPWCSIDNDDSRDLDQLSVGIAWPDGSAQIMVAVADVDASVPKGSKLDEHAAHNSASVYSSAKIYPMLPDKLSTDFTSLGPDVDRLAVVIEMRISADGRVLDGDVFRATVRNKAKLAYDAVAAWLDGDAPMPEVINTVPGLADDIRLQDEVAQRLKARRNKQGALNFESIEARAVFDGNVIADLVAQEDNRARELIEEFMIAANGVVARYLAGKGFPSLRRVVRTPKRWGAIVDLAASYGTRLPNQPDPRALNRFLHEQQARDPIRFPDLSLSVVKLMGAGEYVAERVAGEGTGHFGLAVRDYAHSTAPNRRYPDLITQRLLKAALSGKRSPYAVRELDMIASHCSAREESIKKIERLVEKSAAALLLQDRVGERFDGVVSGLSEFGAWVRLLDPPVEGRLSEAGGVASGQAVHVELMRADVERGFVDFRLVLRRGKTMPAHPARASARADRSPVAKTRGERPAGGRPASGKPPGRRPASGKPASSAPAAPAPGVAGADPNAPRKPSRRPTNTVPKAFRKKQRTGKRKPPPSRAG